MSPPSDALKKAIKRYKSTEQGKQKQQEAFERWAENNPEAYRQHIKKAQEKYEQKPDRKAAKAEWMREYRQRKKLEKQQAKQDEQEQEIAINTRNPATIAGFFHANVPAIMPLFQEISSNYVDYKDIIVYYKDIGKGNENLNG